jgi:hypothetical protein
VKKYFKHEIPSPPHAVNVEKVFDGMTERHTDGEEILPKAK